MGRTRAPSHFILYNPDMQTNTCEQTLGNSEKGKLSFKRKKPPTESGSGRGGHLLQLVGGEGRKMEERHAVEETQR